MKIVLLCMNILVSGVLFQPVVYGAEREITLRGHREPSGMDTMKAFEAPVDARFRKR